MGKFPVLPSYPFWGVKSGYVYIFYLIRLKGNVHILEFSKLFPKIEFNVKM